jgi:hypothetical protein
MVQVVCLDSNVWIKEGLLRSSVAAAFLFALRKRDSHILLPKIVRSEVEERVIAECQVIVGRIDKDLVSFQALTGSKPGLEWPSSEKLSKLIAARFDELSTLLRECQHDPPKMGRALNRVISRVAPSHHKEQFRDSLIWETVVEISHADDVALITDDSDFYGPSKDLHPLLAEEIRLEKLNLEVFRDIDSYLKSVSHEELRPDLNLISRLLDDSLRPGVAASVSRWDIVLIEVTKYQITPFATEKPNQLAIRFDMTYSGIKQPAGSVSGDPVSIVVSSGTCMYDLDKSLVRDVHTPLITALGPDGRELNKAATFYMSGGISIGLPRIPHTVRRELK